MKYKVATKWVKALKSGDYKQTLGDLRHGHRYCVLGVLCNLYTQETGKNWRTPLGNELPDSVMKWSGLKSKSGKIKGASSLIDLNDCVKLPFDRLADVIKKNWKNL